MAPRQRIVQAGLPHHVTQRGNRGQQIFFAAADYLAYRHRLALQCAKHGVQVWAYCLMPNHVHLILTPASADSLARAVGEAHRQYARQLNRAQQQSGHVWESRFHSVVLDEAHLVAAARYVARNPVRSGLVARAEAWPWSSVAAHLAGADDELVRVAPLRQRIGDWRDFVAQDVAPEMLEHLRRHARLGWPLGTDDFVRRLEAAAGRPLRPGKRGPRPGLRQRRKAAQADN